MEMGSHVLLVCTGNTCRSPMAAVHLRAILESRGLDIPVRSAGIAAAPGQPATEHAVRAVRTAGLDLSQHASSPLTDELIRGARVVLTMTQAHKDEVLRRYPGTLGLVFTLGEFAGGEYGSGWEVSDPFGASVEAYDACSRQLQQVLNKVADRLANEGSARKGTRP